MKNKTILITGGAGFAGSNLALSLKNKYPQIDIIVFDNLKRRGSELNLPRLKAANIEFLHGDIRNNEDLVFNRKIDLIIECSAEPSVLAGYSDNPQYIISTNLAGSINCFEIARKNNADVIFISTSRVYPYKKLNELEYIETENRFNWCKNYSNGINEKFSLDGPKTLYGATKLASEILLTEYAEQYGIKYIINRFGVLAGPWQFGKVDQGVLTFWLKTHIEKSELKYIGFGGKGKQVRDFLHINDFCNLIDIQIKNINTINNQVFNIGGGLQNSASLAELTEKCVEITGNKINIENSNENRPGDVRIYITDNTKIKNTYKWNIEKNIDNILTDTYNWLINKK